MAGGGGGYTPEPSVAEIESSKIAIEKWNDYLRQYTPVEDALQQRIERMDDGVYQNELAAQAASQASAATSQAYATPANLNSGAQRGILSQSFRDAALAQGLAQSAAPLAAQKRKWDAQYAYAQAGSGISGEGLGRLSQLGSIENTANINAAKIAADRANSGLLTLGELAKAGASTYYAYQKNQAAQQRYDQIFGRK